MKPVCTFTETPREYRINGRVVPSVTQVLNDLIPGWKASQWHMDTGTAVHAYAALLARGQAFEIPDEDPDNRALVEGKVAALRRFFAEVRPEILDVEMPVYSKLHQYAGRLDLATKIKAGRCIVDFKATLTPALRYQLAAYSLAYGETTGTQPPAYGFGVAIRADGTYQMSETFYMPKYRAPWLGLLSAYNTRRSCGIKEETAE